jgi:hypothetical protein
MLLFVFTIRLVWYPKRQSESVYRRRSDNTMPKEKYKRTNNDLQNTHKTKDRVTRTPLKTIKWTLQYVYDIKVNT